MLCLVLGAAGCATASVDDAVPIDARGTPSVSKAPEPEVELVAAGRGCNDGFCIWLQGFNLSMATEVVVKDHNWNVLNTYSGNELVYALGRSPPQINFVVATTPERTELAAYGLILTVADHGTWDNIHVAP